MLSRTLAALAASALLLSAAPAPMASAASASPVAPAAASAVAAPATVGSAVVPAAASGQQWSVSPADASGPDGRISLRHTIDPGGSADDAIAVTNLGAEPATYAVAPGDGLVGDDGAFDVSAGTPQDSGAWMRIDGLDAGTVAVAPGETRILPVHIIVPADATPGDHPAGIVVGQTRSADGVSVTNRIGVRVHLQVAGEIAPALTVGQVAASFTPSWIPFAPGTLRVESEIANSGNVRLGARSTVSGVGVDTAAAAADAVELLPGDRATVVIETSAWPVFVVAGTAATTPVALGEDIVSLPATVEGDFSVFAPSWSGIALILLVLGVVVALVVRRRGRAARTAETPTDAPDAERPPVKPSTAEGEEVVGAGARTS